MPLPEKYPQLVRCDPSLTYGCISRCHRSVYAQTTDLLQMCAMVGCISECTKLADGECQNYGKRACDLIKKTLLDKDLACGVDCSLPR